VARKRDEKSDQLYRLTADGVSVEFRAPSEGAALNKAVNLLMFDERQASFRDGEILAPGDYLLSLVGPAKDEPYMIFRKHENDSRAVVSWKDA